MSAIGIDIWLACGYSLVLLAIGYLIDQMARRAARKIEVDHAGGFTYDESHDAWLCPEDQWLWPQAFDPENRVMRYRGSPLVCNSCPVKHECTTSTGGREVVRAIDSWPASEAARFHRGIACSVGALGLVWPIGMLLSGPTGLEAAVLAGTLVLVALLSLPLWSHLRRTPALYPEAVAAGVPVRSLDESIAARRQEAANHQRRRTRYGSDRKQPEGIA